MANGGGILRERRTVLPVGYKQTCRDSSQRNQPWGIFCASSEWTGPDLFLVINKVFNVSREIGPRGFLGSDGWRHLDHRLCTSRWGRWKSAVSWSVDRVIIHAILRPGLWCK